MTTYKFDPEGIYAHYADEGRKIWVLDIGAELGSGQVFDPAEFGHPNWVPEPNPHPLFLDLSAPATPAKPIEGSAPAPAPSVITDEHAEEEV